MTQTNLNKTFSKTSLTKLKKFFPNLITKVQYFTPSNLYKKTKTCLISKDKIVIGYQADVVV